MYEKLFKKAGEVLRSFATVAEIRQYLGIGSGSNSGGQIIIDCGTFTAPSNYVHIDCGSFINQSTSNS